MSMKICPVCGYRFKDGDKVIACMLAEYKEIPSSVNVAIGQPEKCIEMLHETCWDADYPQDLGDDE